MVVQVTGTDADGDALARPASWDPENGPPPLILMHPEPPGRPALAPGERVLARLKPVGAGRYEGRTMRRLADAPSRILGVFRHGHGENRIIPTDRRAKAEWMVPPGKDGGAAGRDRAGGAAGAPSPPGPEAGAGDRAAGQHGRRALGQPDRHPHARYPAGVSRRGAGGGRARAPCCSAAAPTCATCRWSPSTARMRAISTMRCSPSRMNAVAGRLPADRRHRRRRALRAARARRSTKRRGPRQLGLFPRPRRADAARGTVQRLVQPAPRRGPPLPVRRAVDRCRRAQDGAPFRPRPDAQRGAA